LNTNQSYRKKVIVRNYSNAARTYTIGNVYRDAPNLTGAILSAPASIAVPANFSASFNLTLTVNAAALPVWTLNGGSNGGDGELLDTVEYAGYLTFTSGAESVHLPWHILPHKAANVLPAASTLALSGVPQTLLVSNTPSTVGGLVDVFSLTGTGVQFPPSALPAPGSDFAVINLQAAGVRLVCLDLSCATFAVQFGISTFGQRSHPDVPAEFDVYLDVNGDGVDDLDVFNADIGFLTTGVNSGQNGVFIADLTTATASGPYFYTEADLDSANAILTAPLSALQTSTGLQLSVSTPFTFSVLAFDNAFTGNLTDLIGPMQYELDMPKVYPAASTFTVPANGSTSMLVFPNNAANVYLTGPYNGHSPSQTGLLLMYTDGKAGQEDASIVVSP
jgi:minor extracellular serine protease Vpr